MPSPRVQRAQPSHTSDACQVAHGPSRRPSTVRRVLKRRGPRHEGGTGRRRRTRGKKRRREEEERESLGRDDENKGRNVPPCVLFSPSASCFRPLPSFSAQVLLERRLRTTSLSISPSLPLPLTLSPHLALSVSPPPPPPPPLHLPLPQTWASTSPTSHPSPTPF